MLYALHTTQGIGTAAFPAPQAVALKEILSSPQISAYMAAGILAGLALTIFTSLAGWGIAGVAFGIGMYVPMELSLPLFAGGIIRFFADKARRTEYWRLLAAGVIAGEGLVGVALALSGFFAFGA